MNAHRSEWRALSTGDKLRCLFLLCLMAGGGTVALLQAELLSEGMTLAGGIICALAFILNPACYSPHARLAPGTAMPVMCRLFVVAGLGGLALGLAAQLAGR